MSVLVCSVVALCDSLLELWGTSFYRALSSESRQASDNDASLTRQSTANCACRAGSARQTLAHARHRS
eukprot:3892518-Pleurochrysis_carterae.AAC.1